MNHTRADVETPPFDGPYLGDVPEGQPTPTPEGPLHTCSAGPRGGFGDVEHAQRVRWGEGSSCGGVTGAGCVATRTSVVGRAKMPPGSVEGRRGARGKCGGCGRRLDELDACLHPECWQRIVLVCPTCCRVVCVVHLGGVRISTPSPAVGVGSGGFSPRARPVVFPFGSS